MEEIFCDVLIAGGGNAALSAAITAAEKGHSVIVADRAPYHMRGGNTRHTRNLRAMHTNPTNILSDSYTEDEYYEDLIRVTEGNTNDKLARLTIQKSAELTDWLFDRGIKFQGALGGTLSLGRTNAFFLGGGRAMLNALYRTAIKLKVKCLCDTEVLKLNIIDNKFKSAVLKENDIETKINAKALIIASGGFQGNENWMKEAWGDISKNFLIRGTPYNTGGLIREMLDNNAIQIGEANQCHAVAIDARAPKYDGGITSRLDAVPFGIVVNKDGDRFYDEGEDFWPKRYAIWGRLIASQPEQIGYCIVDAKSINSFMPSVFPAIQADDINSLAKIVNLDPKNLNRTINNFNDSIVEGEFNHTILDNCYTKNINVPKTHWARKIDEAPFYLWPLRPGITFTYLGLKVNENAEVEMKNLTIGNGNIFAAGETMAGNVLGKGYLAGIGMTIGTVFGRLAGEGASNYVSS